MALIGNISKISRFCCLNEFKTILKNGTLNNEVFTVSVRTKKHYNPKFRWLRSKKIIPVDLEDKENFHKTIQEELHKFKIYPRYWKKRSITISSVGGVIDPYEPVVGEGKTSFLSTKAVKTASKNKIDTTVSLRKIKNFEPNFHKDLFLQNAHDIYVKAHELSMKNDMNELSDYVAETAISQMLDGLTNKTLRWKFIKSLEPPKLIQARTQEVFVEKNLFAQITVRFHTQQSLAIYDRFGRLIHGSEMLAKDVLEYVVFEKHINNMYGKWRLLAKIIPEAEDLQPKRTYMIKGDEEEEDEDVPKDFIETDSTPVLTGQ